MTWTTQFPSELTKPYNCAEPYIAFFAPKGWPGKGTTYALLLPEGELQCARLGPNGETIAIIANPPKDKNVKKLLQRLCEEIQKEKAVLTLACDTEQQLNNAVETAVSLLSEYERIPLERMIEAKTRTKAGLQ